MPTLMGQTKSSRGATDGVNLRDRRWNKSLKFDRVFIVWSDTCDQDETIIALTPGLPALFSTFYGVPLVNRRFRDIETFKHNSNIRTIWHVTCSYSSEQDVPEEGQEDQLPEHKTPHVRWYGEQEITHPEDDVLGIPIENSAGEQMLIDVPIIYPILEIKRYEQSPFDPDTIMRYVNTVNLEEFWGAPPGAVLFLPIESERVRVDNLVRENVTYRFKFKLEPDPTGMPPAVNDRPDESLSAGYLPDTWGLLRPHDWGTAERMPDIPIWYQTIPGIGAPLFRAIADFDGNLTGVYLDGSGNKLGTEPDGVTLLPRVRLGPFSPYYYADFDNLNLGPF